MHKNLLRKNVLMLLLLVAFMIISAGAAFAQDLPQPLCGKLDEADCTILADSQKAMMDVESLTTSSSIDLNLSGIPDLPFDELALNLTQDSTISMDPAVVKSLADFQAQLATAKPSDVEKLTKDYTNLIIKLYQTLGLAMDLTLTMPQDIADLLSAQAGGEVTVPEKINIQVRMVDGYLYVNLDKLAEVMPELAEFKGWYGVDMVTLVTKGLEQAEKRQASEVQGFQAGLGAGTFVSSDAFREMVKDYVNVERQEDDKLDLQTVAVFNTTFDFGGFVASQAFQDLLKGQLDTINQISEQKITAQEFDEGMMGLRFLGPALFQDLKFNVVQNIGEDDSYVYRSETHLSWDLKSLMGFVAMAQGGGKTPAAMPDTAPVISFDVTTDYADFNDTTAIEKPEDAVIIPLDQIDMNSVQ